MDYLYHYGSPLGGITLSSNGRELTGLWFDGQKYFGSTLGSERQEMDIPVFRQASEWLDRYFQGQDPGPVPPLRLEDTAFRKAVWRALGTIPYGQTATYGQIAQKAAAEIGRTRVSARAAGSAVGRNPISLMIPCHRVIGADGSLTGYAGGLERKQKLLLMEKENARKCLQNSNNL